MEGATDVIRASSTAPGSSGCRERWRWAGGGRFSFPTPPYEPPERRPLDTPGSAPRWPPRPLSPALPRRVGFGVIERLSWTTPCGNRPPGRSRSLRRLGPVSRSRLAPSHRLLAGQLTPRPSPRGRDVLFASDYQTPGSNLHRTSWRYASYGSLAASRPSSAMARPMLQLVTNIITSAFHGEMLCRR